MNNSQKNKKEQRQSLYVTVVVIMMMVAVIIAVATALAKEESAPASKEEESVVVAEGSDSGEELDDVLFDDEESEGVFLEEEDNKKDEEETESSGDEGGGEDKEESPAVNSLPEFCAPVKGEVLKGCSMAVPVFSKTMEDYRTHGGVDLYCSAGADIAAAAEGKIIRIWDDPMMGMSISVEHSGGAVSTYQNLYDELPSGIVEGKSVRQGEIIASAGNSALAEIAEESHLHFELSVNGERVDPAEYMTFSQSPDYRE